MHIQRHSLKRIRDKCSLILFVVSAKVGSSRIPDLGMSLLLYLYFDCKTQAHKHKV